MSPPHKGLVDFVTGQGKVEPDPVWIEQKDVKLEKVTITYEPEA